MAHSAQPIDNREAILLGHQPDQVQIGSIVRFGIGLTISVILVFVVILFLLRYFEGRDIARADEQPPMMAVADPNLFPRPRLQEHPSRNLEQYREEIGAKVNSYGWVDEKAGIARIPIDRALELTAEKQLLKSSPTSTKAEDSGADASQVEPVPAESQTPSTNPESPATSSGPTP